MHSLTQLRLALPSRSTGSEANLGPDSKIRIRSTTRWHLRPPCSTITSSPYRTTFVLYSQEECPCLRRLGAVRVEGKEVMGYVIWQVGPNTPFTIFQAFVIFVLVRITAPPRVWPISGFIPHVEQVSADGIQNMGYRGYAIRVTSKTRSLKEFHRSK